MSARGVVLALLAAVVFGGSVFVQDPEAWQVEDPDYWIGLIEKYTPTVKENAACWGYLGYAADAVADAASQGRLLWDTRIGSDRGQARFSETFERTWLLINPDHPEHVDDYQISMTMAHEGLHWHYGIPRVINGKLMTKDEAETWVRNTIDTCYEDKEKEEPTCGEGADCGGGETPEPVCEEKQVKETYTDSEREWREAEICLPWESVGASFCTTVGKYVWVPVEKVRWVTKTVCEN